MSTPPVFHTERLTMRSFQLSDASEVQRLAGDYAIAKTTLGIPHPYPERAAEEWIGSLAESYRTNQLANFAITLREKKALIGSIGLILTLDHKRAEAGYWIGKPYWRNGYASEALGAILYFGFHTLSLNRIHAQVFAGNPSSERVLIKNGLTFEGKLKQHVIKEKKYIDLKQYAILRSDYIKD
ncbi:MAG: GNAT family N-acetyltransferase [Calditrichia bacterium]